ncbi:Formamidase [Umbelopsis sp. PMI_123]|nr:Formamidase [Umbelopsis sp. PMI_123]
MSKSRSIHTVKQTHLAWDNTIPPVQRIRSGEIVSFECVDASNGQVTQNSTIEVIKQLEVTSLDQVNGPIYVEEAEPGDVLEIEILDVKTDIWGWTAIIPGFGLLADEFPEPQLKIWNIQRDETAPETGYAWFKPGIKIPIAPFCGEMGLAPAEAGKKSTIPPYHHGGNMDTKHIVKGSKLYLPIQVKGALFSLGDGHAAQGDGECCGTAIETPIFATVRLTVHKSFKISEPQFVTAGPLATQTNTAPFYCCTGVDSDLVEATRKSIRNMIDYLQRTKGLTRQEAYMLCSVVVDLKLCEVVDMPNFVVGAFLPTSIFVDNE